ncbi:alpha-L-fucosidase [Bacteroides sp. 519]|uniref:alpha-L-fucosidase n=1 Tax=Bacteroides sp. 519 TaxID=2302937 RepID=UPI0013D220A7|nr:alpha-L-fucosidase [Bacteroides sp. 519]NDV58393.1 glycoside hydrolase family 29 (alpha-L-fucosidase) [Bacteroides sp. 519]
MRKLFFSLLAPGIIAGSFFTSCNQPTSPPAPYGAIPSEHQLEWQKMEYYMFIHFGPNTFTNVEWGDGKEDPKVFNPTNLDCRQWASIAKDAGMKAIIITAKHHDGFCLWPSNYSTHTVRESLWKDGKGDLLRELSDACKEYGLKFGVYLSPWDQNHPAYGTPEYNQIFANTLNEVLSGYGHVFEQWFDGANGEGPNGKKQEYDWDLFHETVYKNQPHAVIFSDIGPGARWMGNERGIAGATNWSTLNVTGFGRGHAAPPQDTLNTGNRNGEAWVPAETDVSIRPGWFYSPRTNDKVKSLEHLMNIYYSSVGRNSNLLLNVPPDRRGLIHPNDSTRLMELKHSLDKEFANNLITNATITAQYTRGNSSTYNANNLINGNYDSYWTTDDDVKQAFIEISLPQPETFNRFLIQEYIPLGQRVASFSVEFWNAQTSQWELIKEATTIGYKRILRFPSVTAQKIRVNIKESLACPILNNIAIYNAPELTDSANDNLSPSKSVNGPLVLNMEKVNNITGFYYIPATNNKANHIVRYNFYTSSDGKNWKLIKENSPFNNIRNNPVRQDILLDTPVKAQYIKIEALETTMNKDTYDLIEFGPLL